MAKGVKIGSFELPFDAVKDPTLTLVILLGTETHLL
jgi:hypothetical protein